MEYINVYIIPAVDIGPKDFIQFLWRLPTEYHFGRNVCVFFLTGKCAELATHQIPFDGSGKPRELLGCFKVQAAGTALKKKVSLRSFDPLTLMESGPWLVTVISCKSPSLTTNFETTKSTVWNCWNYESQQGENKHRVHVLTITYHGKFLDWAIW